MLYGTVVKYCSVKRFGFIRPDFGPDVFFHATALGFARANRSLHAGSPSDTNSFAVPSNDFKEVACATMTNRQHPTNRFTRGPDWSS